MAESPIEGLDPAAESKAQDLVPFRAALRT